MSKIYRKSLGMVLLSWLLIFGAVGNPCFAEDWPQ